MTSTISRGKQADLSTEWGEWIWSEENGCSYSTRLTANGEPEYIYDYPKVQHDIIPRHTAPNWETEGAEEAEPTAYVITHEKAQDIFFPASEQPQNHTVALNLQKSFSAAIRGINDLKSPSNIQEAASLEANPEDGWIGTDTKSAAELEVILKPTRFFKIGRVFRTLWSEPAGDSSIAGSPNHITSPLGGNIFTQMRHFVVVREMKGCSICLSLFTYNAQGTTKKGVEPKDYAAVYAMGSSVSILPGEQLIKEPFPIIVENTLESIHPMSRLNFGRMYTVEHNVKVVKVGRISDEHHARLTSYLVQTIFGPLWKEVPIGGNPTKSVQESAERGKVTEVEAHPLGNLAYADEYTTRFSTIGSKRYMGNSASFEKDFASLSLVDPASEIIQEDHPENRNIYPPTIQVHGPSGQVKIARHINRDYSHRLDARFTVIDEKKNKRFWKPGRVFMMLWTEPARSTESQPAGDSDSQFETVWLGQKVFSEIRRFVIIGAGYGNVICSPIHTYGGQATLKPNLPEREQHAIIYTSEKPPAEACMYDVNGTVIKREDLVKDPIRVVRELHDEEGDLGTVARLNYSKIYTVEKYIRVLNIGKVHEDSIGSLLSSCFFARPEDQPVRGPRKPLSSSSSSSKAKDSRDRMEGNGLNAKSGHRRKAPEHQLTNNLGDELTNTQHASPANVL